MRSHVAPPSHSFHPHKPQQQEEPEEENESSRNESSHSPASSSFVKEEEGDEGKAQALYYGLRENPKKSFRLVDPEFSFAIDSGSVIQDRESETESPKNPFRRRSKRRRRPFGAGPEPEPEPEAETEPVSSVSDTTPEEDVALSLMMLSRDIWMTDGATPFAESQGEGEQQKQEVEEEMKFCPRGRNKYQCWTCKKVFRSYQALGGHRASHKKIRSCDAPSPPLLPSATTPRHEQTHQCPFCFRVFKSGQALGGHKRSHFTTAAYPTAPVLDLNQPLSYKEDDEEFSQVELSAVSDAGFINPIK